MFKKLGDRSEVNDVIEVNGDSRVSFRKGYTSDHEWKNHLKFVSLFLKKNSSFINPLFKQCSGDVRPFVVVDILGIECNALADSGASVSVISKEALFTLSELGLCFDMTPCHNELFVGNDARLDVLGRVSLPISYYNKVIFIKFFVCKDINVPIILGADFLRAFNLCKDIFEATEVHNKLNVSLLNDDTVHLHQVDDLSDAQKYTLCEMISLYETLGASDESLGFTTLEEHTIDTGDHAPIKQRYYPIPYHQREYVKQEIEKMLKMGIIERSNSAWNSPIVIVPKSNGELRMCLDSRKLNSVTKVDTYPMPLVQEILDSLNNAKFMSSIDLKSAFFQLNLDMSSREKTCFSIPGLGSFQFCRMPFGLVNATARMMRLMDKVFGPEFAGKVFYYVDDIILISDSFENHMSLLKRVFDRLKQAGLTINFEKSVFCRSSLKFLGFVVDRRGLRTDSDKVKSIVDFPVPTSQKEVRRFLGMVSWYRRFIVDFSTVIAPLSRLTGKLPKGHSFSVNEDALQAFNTIKSLLISAPILSVPKFDRPFIISSDASDVGLGCCLSQLDNEGAEHPVAFASRTLTRTERNHSTTEKELNALMFALEKFKGYIEGSPFQTKVYTDHSSLKWLASLKSPSGRLSRWALRISQFNFSIEYRKGSENKVADALSRAPVSTLSTTPIKDPWYLHFREKVQRYPDRYPDWRLLNDHLFKRIRSPNPLLLEFEWKRVIPLEERHSILQKCHDSPDAAHLGVFKTLKRVSQCYFWPKLVRDVKKYVKHCEVCLTYKSTNLPLPGLMQNPKKVQRPFQVLSTDLLGPLPRSREGFRFILVVSDYFTKYTCLFPLRNSLAKTVVRYIENHVFMRFGVPQCIIMDNGPQYISREMQGLKEKYKIPNFFFNCRFTPQNNPSERVNRVLVTAISSYVGKNHRTWADEIHKIEFAINTSVHEVTKHSPYFLNHGREAVLSGDWYPPRGDEDFILDFSDRKHYDSLPLHLKTTFEKVQSHMQKSYEHNKIFYNRSRRHVDYQVGQVVWKREFPLSDASKYFTHKFAPKFRKCIVTKRVSSVVYELSDFQSKKPLGIWHVKDILKSHPSA